MSSNVVDTYAWLASRHLSPSRRARFVADLVDFFAVYHRETYGWDGAPIHDAVAVAQVIRPGIVTTVERNVEIELASDLCRGRTVVDRWSRTARNSCWCSTMASFRNQRRSC